MPLGLRAALILGLVEGPAFVQALVLRISKVSNGAVVPNLGAASRMLRALKREGLVRAWTIPAAGGVGRRRYYELIPDGILAAEKLRRDLGGLVSPRRDPVSLEERKAMAARFKRACALSDSVRAFRDAGRRAGLGTPESRLPLQRQVLSRKKFDSDSFWNEFNILNRAHKRPS